MRYGAAGRDTDATRFGQALETTRRDNMGDGVLIYFGCREAHEDDAERAARAGLAVIDAVPHKSR